MTPDKFSAIVISASSDIGTAMCNRWISKGWTIFGTYRTSSAATQEILKKGGRLVQCDLSRVTSIQDACAELRNMCPKWDVLVVCPGIQDPIGAFSQCGFDEWELSLKVNFSSQLRIIHELLPNRRNDSKHTPCVLLFAGGGTNNATINYSAYTISKIALIKMCEFLDAEIPDSCFSIIGPGWVKTKIHESTLKAEDRAGGNYQRTLDKLSGDECTPMDQVLDCCEWVIHSPRELVSGRNFSVVYDKWGQEELAEKLREEFDMYKLRRYGNDWVVE